MEIRCSDRTREVDAFEAAVVAFPIGVPLIDAAGSGGVIHNRKPPRVVLLYSD